VVKAVDNKEKPMRTLAVSSFVSLDGVIQAPGGPHEDPTGGFDKGGWAVGYFDDEMMSRISNSEPYELLLGRGTYEIFAAHWPYDEGPIADHLNATRKHVASTTLDDVAWTNATLIEGDVADYVKRLKAENGPEIQVHGSPGLIQTLLEHDLVDEFRMWIFPVAVGAGKRLFGDGTIPVAFKLVDSFVSKTGVTVNSYARAGEIEIGEMDFEEPTEAELERRERLAPAD
jgi:dihydrofolate reductase